LLNSGIRRRSGHDRGAIHGWKYLNQTLSTKKSHSYPFLYSEATGYAITCFSWAYSELGIRAALEAAKQSAQWVIGNLGPSSLLIAGKITANDFDQKGDLSNQVYAFDNGIVMMGLLNLYRITSDDRILVAADTIAAALVKKFFNSKRRLEYALLDSSFRPTIRGIEKWSTVPGPYHSKLSIGFLEL
jgi:uncharacterized protein YyaL (SSP411 family)